VKTSQVVVAEALEVPARPANQIGPETVELVFSLQSVVSIQITVAVVVVASIQVPVPAESLA
jgi:hypothetical protein